MLGGMKKIASIHTFEDDSFHAWMVRGSTATIVAGLVVAVAWRALSACPGFPLPAFEPIDGPAWMLALAAGVVLPLGVHELVHAIAFKAFAPAGSRVSFGANWKLGMVYACAEGVVYTRRQYEVIALAPTIVVTLLLVACGLHLAWPLWTIMTVAVHLSGCTGDWGYIRAIRRDGSIAYCEDTSWGVQFYSADEEGDGRP